MSEKSAAQPEGTGKRVNRRVQWKPEGVEIDPRFDDQPLESHGEDWAERALSNDEQLKRDKPPHWG